MVYNVSMVKFILNAIGKTIYVDVDGTILRNLAIPESVPAKEKFFWWKENLGKSDIIFSRLVLCIILRMLGCKLVIWTNRGEEHRDVTMQSLGFAKYIFSNFEFHNGKKSKTYSADKIVIDDDARYKNNYTLHVDTI
jgi:hypothetical protein